MAKVRRTTIDLSDTVFTELKKYALENKTTSRSVIHEALLEKFDREKKERPKVDISSIYYQEALDSLERYIPSETADHIFRTVLKENGLQPYQFRPENFDRSIEKAIYYEIASIVPEKLMSMIKLEFYTLKKRWDVK